MTIKPLKFAAAVVALGALGSAHAASVSISPDFTVAAVGDTVSFNISGDFSDADALLAGGSIDVNYGAGLAFLDASVIGAWDQDFSFAVGDNTDGTASYVFGTFTGVDGAAGPVDLLQISFTVLGNSTITLATSGEPGASGWLTFNGTPIDPDYGTAEVVVPLPAAVWFMLSGLGALIGFGRKRA